MKKYTIEEAREKLRGNPWPPDDYYPLEKKETITFNPMKDNWSEFNEILKNWNTSNLEQLHEIDNAPNEHVTDNSIQFPMNPPHEEPPKEFKISIQAPINIDNITKCF